MITKAKAFGDEVSAVVFGKGVEALAPEFANTVLIKVYVVEGDVFANYNTGAFVAPDGCHDQGICTQCVLFAHTFNGRDFASRLAQKLEAGLATDAIDAQISAGKGVFTRANSMLVKHCPRLK
jgi:electron transfer flavoprotein alpha subunit